MGKLLLVKNNNNKTPDPARKLDASKTLTNYFRTQKLSTPQVSDSTAENSEHKPLVSPTEQSSIEKASSKLIKTNASSAEAPCRKETNAETVVSASTNTEASSIKKLSIDATGTKATRIEATSSKIASPAAVPLEIDDDDLSSLSSLQSEDDVLGPWSRDHLCVDCEDLRDEAAGPIQSGWWCSRCKQRWVEQVNTWGNRISKRCKTKKPPRQNKKPRRTNKTAAPPPTKSRVTKDDKYVTTGAFMTRKTAKQLADPEYGFHPNPYGYVHNQEVEVLNINGHWYRGVLTMMQASKVKVSYIDWEDQEEWINIGSRRIRIYTSENIDEDEDDVVVEKVVESVQERAEEQSFEDPLLPQLSSKTKGNDDYVSATLDMDPNQLFNEVFLTRRMARELTDEHGFRANSFGYRHNRAVAVTFKASRGHNKVEYLGYLREMRMNQVRVWYPTLRQSDWLVVGSRRLRLLTGEEELVLKDQQVPLPPPIDDNPKPDAQPSNDANPDEAKPNPLPSQPLEKIVEEQAQEVQVQDEQPPAPVKRKRGRPRKYPLQPQAGPKPTPSATTTTEPVKPSQPAQTKTQVKRREKEEKEECTKSLAVDASHFMTTGAFATRRAMRQLKDEHGFVPNPYGYSYNQPIEILNTRTGKNKFWERGKLIEMKPNQVKVRYDGWSELYDEWFMVGSRRIRPVSTTDPGASTPYLPITTDLMVPEANPELKNKASRQHRVLGIEDYEQLGYLVSANATPPARRGRPPKKPSAPKPETAETPSSSEASDYAHQKRTIRRRRQKRPNKKRKQVKCHPEPPSQKIVSTGSLRRGTAANADNDAHGFVANDYGFDYMQHVQVLNLDKKWYEARLVRMDRNRVLIHYCGWVDKFDEYVALGSRRLQVIENAHEVECVEPNYQERYEALLLEQQNQDITHEQTSSVTRRNNRRRTLSEGPYDQEEGGVEYHKELENEADVEEIDRWKVYCNQCNVVIKQFRYYCTYCETPSEGHDYQSFELCLRCFDQNFPFWHDHPRSSFAVQAVINAEIGPMPIKGELVTVWEEDVMDDPAQETGPAQIEEASKVFTGSAPIETDEQGYKFLKRWQRRKVCAFCNDDDDTSSELGSFIGPFVIATYNKNGVERKRQFWAHDACARYTPEVFCTPDGKWYNVTLALRRGRGMRCYGCKEKGATIGCFDSRCNKSFHLPCAQKPVSYFRNGVIFWCPTHEAYYNKKDTYVNIFKCDGCNKQMEDESWFTCLPCASGYFSSFDLCAECFENLPQYNHPHDQDDFEETSFAILKEMEAEKAREAARAKEISAAKRKKPLFPRRRRKRAGDAPVTTCCYCGTEEADEWRKGYDGGVIMCRPCFEVALLVDSNDGSGGNTNNVDDDSDRYVTLIEDYTHKPYLTRDALSATKFSNDATVVSGIRLSTYEPQPHQLFSLIFDSTYYDIPGRAPRWATHSGTDYHGTWLPQTVRRAILKHTEKDERVLSNFLGRGTDAIECFLLQRRCCGVDINPAAVALSQRNCCFEIPPGLTSAEYRPIIAQADSRNLTGPLFADESFHHILSHPPYKDCVAYSTHLEGDLSRFTNIDEFKEEYINVVHESWRLLKMGRRLTLGIGDNREHCFYIPVGFHLIRQYIDNGFELEELIIKRQRYCSAFGLGTYLCVQFDFLVFTHEFIATFRKIPRENVNRMISLEEDSGDHVRVTRTMRGIPSSAIARKSVVMGTVWVFKPTENYRFDQLCMSRMVERFGRDETNWLQIQLDFMSFEFQYPSQVQNETEVPVTEQKDEEEENLLSEYEQQRLKRIEENTRTLVQLGLLSELSEDSTDVMHYETMMCKPPREESTPLRLMVVAHLPHLLPHHIGLYRRTLIQLATEATEKLAPLGMFIVGTQDVRSADGKLWPMGMLVMEDIERSVDVRKLKLKEMIVAVPDGYSKDRHRQAEEAASNEEDVDVVDEHLQIVHATYLVFQRL
ncbi:hypothetical protein BJV82DRAFT_585375 [Fennellomyces sp. T-0311]|nr:hypothetical protein BJV82DRAFT_585375 [Fennellomyces sp. T-0311]